MDGEKHKLTKSQKRIIAAFEQLMKKKAFSAIKVTEICELADVHNSTFYKYYEDIFDLRYKLDNVYFKEFKKKLSPEIESHKPERLLDKLVESWPDQYSCRNKNWGDGDSLNIMITKAQEMMALTFKPYSSEPEIKAMILYLMNGFHMTLSQLYESNNYNKKTTDAVKTCAKLIMYEMLDLIFKDKPFEEKQDFILKTFQDMLDIQETGDEEKI